MTPPAPTQESERLAAARRQLRGSLVVRAILAAAGAAVSAVAAVLLARAGVVDHVFPAYVAGDEHTVIPGYSGPHWAAAIGLGALAGLLLVSALTDGWRRFRLGRRSPGTMIR